ncbi:MAG: hypothetical protein M3Y77_21770 [Actinomycetota bacterium]|nr:hypothetical protein [Actinomycetota bacterium]
MKAPTTPVPLGDGELGVGFGGRLDIGTEGVELRFGPTVGTALLDPPAPLMLALPVPGAAVIPAAPVALDDDALSGPVDSPLVGCWLAEFPEQAANSRPPANTAPRVLRRRGRVTLSIDIPHHVAGGGAVPTVPAPPVRGSAPATSGTAPEISDSVPENAAVPAWHVAGPGLR